MNSVDAAELVKVLIIGILITLWLHWLWSRRHLYALSFKFPHYIGLPFVGIMLRIRHINNLVSVFSQMFKECKAYTFHVWLGLYSTIVTADPEFIEQVLLSPELLNKMVIYNSVKPAVGNGLLLSPVDMWHSHRKLLNPVFSQKNLLGFLGSFKRASRLINRELGTMANDGKLHELEDTFKELSLNLVAETSMGIQMDGAESFDQKTISIFNYVIKTVAQTIVAVTLNLHWVYELHRIMQNALKYLLGTIEQILKTRWQDFEFDFVSTEDENKVSMTTSSNRFIDRILELHKKGIFSWQDVKDHATTLIIASFDTTAITLFSTLAMLAMHPHIQERLFEEIVTCFPSKDYELEYEHMSQLPYLEMVIHETLRLSPPFTVVGRRAVKDTVFRKDLTLPKGTQILISIFHMHRRTDIWGPNANAFDPDNFLPERVKSRHSYSYMPFSKGPRNCIGYRYSILALKVLLAGIIRNYRFETDMPYEKLEPIMNISLGYKEEPSLRIYTRE